MKNYRTVWCTGLFLLAGCAHRIDTLPPVAKPGAPLREITLEIPEGFEVRSIDYDAAMYSSVSGSGGMTSTSAGGRAFVKVLAVERSSGQQVLLLYENVSARSQPVEIIRFRSGPSIAQDSSGTPGQPRVGTGAAE